MFVASLTLLAALAAPVPAISAQTASAPAGDIVVYDAAFFAGAQLSTALDIVQRVPGFTVDTGDGLRGYAGSAGNVLIDGQRTPSKADSLREVLQRIPAASVARVEIIRGGAPGIDMQGRTVLANVVLKSTARTDLSLVAVGRALGDRRGLASGRAELEHRDGQLSFTTSLVLYQYPPDDQGKGTATQTAYPGGPLQSRTGVKVETGDNGATFRTGLQAPWRGGIGHLNLALDYDTFRENEDDHVTDLTQGGALRTDTANQQDRNRKGELGADYAFGLGHNIVAKVVALQALGTESFGARNVLQGSLGRYRQLIRTGESIGRVELNWKPSRTFSLEGGGEAVFNFLQSGSVYAQDGAPVPLPSANIRVEEQRFEAFAVASWRLRPTLQLEAGGRIETSSLTQSGDSAQSASFSFPKPRVALTWTPNLVDQLRVTFERVVGQLNFADFATSANLVSGQVNGGNANLEPQREWRSELAYERKLFGKGSAAITLRHADIEQVLDVIPVQGVDAPGNIGNGVRDTALAALTLPLGGVGLSGGQFKADLTWVRSRVTDPTTRQPRAISGDKPFSGLVSLTNDVPRLKSSWEIDVNALGRTPTWRIEEVRVTDVQPQVDLIWIYRPRPRQTLQFQLSNAFNRERQRSRTDWTGPRNISPVLFQEQFAVTGPPVAMIRFRQGL